MTRGFVVAAPSTGAGKTTVSLGLMAAFRNRGLVVQPFKVGPDFIDPAYHTRVCDRPSINLDLWMCGEEFVCETFAHHGCDADLAMVEGVMGLFDGCGMPDCDGSTAHLARVLGLPVLLVVDGYTAAESLAAQVLGCETYDPGLTFAGVVVDRTAGERHITSIRHAIESKCRTPFLGAIPNDPDISMPERQLGLISVHENPLSESSVEVLASALEQNVNLDRLSESIPEIDFAPIPPSTEEEGGCPRRIGIARDAAFCFYYEDNLRLLRESGAELIEFSPLADATLPDNLDLLYLGGGFPEEFATDLAQNRAMLDTLRDFPGYIWAECGGLILLVETFYDRDNTPHSMAGRIPGSIEMTDTIAGFGYREVTTTRDTVLAPLGTTLRGHEFHWSRWRAKPTESWGVLKNGSEEMGYSGKTVVASYFHAHLGRLENASRIVKFASNR